MVRAAIAGIRSTAHATLDRIDVLALDNTGTLVKIDGTAAAQPTEPDYNAATQLKLTFVLVSFNTTSPPSVSNESIYLENTEWTSSTSGTGWNANSSSNPRTGTKDIEGTTVATTAYVQLQRGSTITLDSYNTLSLFVRSKATWTSGRILRLQFYATGVAKGNAVTLASGYWGFDSSITASYQLVGIPVAQFAVPGGTTINQLRITDIGGSIGLYIDDVVLQVTGTSTGTQGGSVDASSITGILPVVHGGTGKSSFTANAFLYSGTAGVPTNTAAPTNGQLLIGSTGAAPAVASLTAGSNITITPGAGSITIASTAGGGGTAQIIEAYSKVPVTSGLVFPNVFVGAGSSFKHVDGLGVEDATTLNANATWALAYHLPPALPTGTAKLRLRCISALSSGALKFNPTWNVCGTAEDCSSVTLNAEGTGTVTYTVAGAFVEVDTTLDASTVTAGKDLLMHLVFEDTNTTAAGDSTCLAFLVFIP